MEKPWYLYEGESFPHMVWHVIAVHYWMVVIAVDKWLMRAWDQVKRMG